MNPDFLLARDLGLLAGKVFLHAIDIITTQGRLSFLTIAWEILDFPEPELPAMAIMLTSAHGGE